MKKTFAFLTVSLAAFSTLSVFGGLRHAGSPVYQVKDDYLHELIKKADLVMPWMVGRFSSLDRNGMNRYRDIVTKDIAWCNEAGVDYVPLVYPGFSWYNLSRKEKGLTPAPVESIPRQRGKFY